MHTQLNLFGEQEAVTYSSVREMLLHNKNAEEMPQFVAYGGGVNSTAMIVLLKKLGIRPDVILFADTGGEQQATYDYLDIFNSWLKTNNMPEITVVRKATNNVGDRKTLREAKRTFKKLLFLRCRNIEAYTYAIWHLYIYSSQYSTLEEQCLVTNTLPSKAYGKSSCSAIWKIEPQELYIKEWLSNHGNGESKIRRFIGYHADETSRLFDKTTRQPILQIGNYHNSYPLVENGINQARCIALILSENLPIPPKSACFFCPSRKPTEVKKLPDELLERGKLIESVAMAGVHRREAGSTKGLGRKFAWNDLNEVTELEIAIIEHNQDNRSCACIDW